MPSLTPGLCACLLALGACGDPAHDLPDAAPEPYAPYISSLTATPEGIGPTGTATFSADVYDQNGVGDILSGTLTNDDTGAVYGTFVYAGSPSEGHARYTLPLSWAAINAVEPINTDSYNWRTFRATFSDTTAQSATQTALLVFSCDDSYPAYMACAGACVDPARDEAHCGSCDNGCGGGNTCVNQTCLPVVASSCHYPNTPTDTCEDICNADGWHCAEGCGPEGDVGNVYYASDGDCQATPPVVLGTALCTTPFSSLSGIAAMRCCCNHDAPYP